MLRFIEPPYIYNPEDHNPGIDDMLLVFLEAFRPRRRPRASPPPHPSTFFFVSDASHLRLLKLSSVSP